MKPNKILVTLVAIATIFSVSSCNSCSSSNGGGSEEVVSVTEIIDIDNILSKAEVLKGKKVTIEGVCTHICAHGAKKIFLMGSDDTKMIRIESSADIGQFKKECINSMVTVNGTLTEDKIIDEAYLQAWEGRVKAQTEEKHGEDEGGCSTEKKARGEGATNSTQGRIDDYRKRIAERNEKDGKAYLSFYHVVADTYEIQ